MFPPKFTFQAFEELRPAFHDLHGLGPSGFRVVLLRPCAHRDQHGQRYRGSCHCRAVRYVAQFDLDAGTNRCNCSLCTKARAWFLFVRGDHFELTEGEEVLSTYEWVPPGRTQPGLTYRFCSKCGIRLFATGELAQLGGRFYAIHVPTVDDMDREQLVRAPLHFIDNAHDRMNEAPADTRLM